MFCKIFSFNSIVFILVAKLNLVSGLNQEKDCECKLKINANIVGGKFIAYLHFKQKNLTLLILGRDSEIGSLPWMASVSMGIHNKKNRPTTEMSENFKISQSHCTGFILNEWFATIIIKKIYYKSFFQLKISCFLFFTGM